MSTGRPLRSSAGRSPLELGIPDRALAAEVPERGHRHEVETGASCRLAQRKERRDGRRVQHAARRFEREEVAAVAAGELHSVQARYDEGFPRGPPRDHVRFP